MADDHFKKIIKRTHETLLDLHGRVKAFQKKDREKNTLRSGGSAISSPHPGLDKDSKIKERVEVEIRFGTMVKFIAFSYRRRLLS
ncbi:hypothetical protein HYV58_01090 [Candidatus Peregrinibacteria bacterium]|nr:hypothetical protein [Candidatus Peregrinibacteria bacterium]